MAQLDQATAVKIQAPHFHKRLENVKISNSKPLVLKCEVKGTPTPTIFWRRDGQLLESCISSYQNGVARLEVLGAGPGKGGVYECVAKNSVTEVTSSCHVTVTNPKGQSVCSGLV